MGWRYHGLSRDQRLRDKSKASVGTIPLVFVFSFVVSSFLASLKRGDLVKLPVDFQPNVHLARFCVVFIHIRIFLGVHSNLVCLCNLIQIFFFLIKLIYFKELFWILDSLATSLLFNSLLLFFCCFCFCLFVFSFAFLRNDGGSKNGFLWKLMLSTNHIAFKMFNKNRSRKSRVGSAHPSPLYTYYHRLGCRILLVRPRIIKAIFKSSWLLISIIFRRFIELSQPIQLNN